MNVNDFTECLEQSHAASELPFWGACYHSAFPTMIAMHNHRHDGQHQRAGIDRSIVLFNGKVIYIDEKVRGRNKITHRVYEDILLEEISDKERNTPGWIVKPLMCDYIAYAIAPLGKCYLLPVIQLQTAWLTHSSLWKQEAKYPREAKNNGWTTVNWPVSVPTLFRAIGDCLRASFPPIEIDDQ